MKRLKVASLTLRWRSRAYSVRCSGSGPLGPVRPKKNWSRRGVAAVPVWLTEARVEGAKVQSGFCPRRSGSSASRTE